MPVREIVSLKLFHSMRGWCDSFEGNGRVFYEEERAGEAECTLYVGKGGPEWTWAACARASTPF